MQERRRFNKLDPLDPRLSLQAERLRKEAERTPPGAERDKLMWMARIAETASHIDRWLSSPGLKVPT